METSALPGRFLTLSTPPPGETKCLELSMCVLGAYRGIRKDSRGGWWQNRKERRGKHMKGFVAARPGKWKEHEQEQARGA